MAIIGPVYHGTRSSFDKFDPLKQDKMALYGLGFYFTEDKEVASGYAEAVEYHDKDFFSEEDLKDYLEDNPNMTVMKKWVEKNLGIPRMIPAYNVIRARLFDSTKFSPQVKKVYLNVNNAFNIDQDKLSPEQLKQIGWEGVRGSSMFHPSDLGRIIQNRPDLAPKLQEKLKLLGYDAITHIGGKITGGKDHRVWIVFDSSQIVETKEIIASFVRGLLNFIKG